MARIIYVEDDDIVADVVRQALSDAGHIVGVIDHGALAYDTIVFKQPDLILLDCSLPGMTGVEILRRVRAIPDIYLTPIVMLTALADQADIDAAVEAGANDYIVKPVDLPTLIARIEAVLASTFYRSKVTERVAKIGKRVIAPEAADATGPCS